MGTSYKVQIDNEKGEYKIQFETTNYDSYKMVERACQKAIDKKDEAVLVDYKNEKEKRDTAAVKRFTLSQAFKGIEEMD